MLNTQNIIDKLKNQGIEADTSQIKLITELVDLNIKKKGFLEIYLTKNIKKSGFLVFLVFSGRFLDQQPKSQKN